jgi:hypothetical protein
LADFPTKPPASEKVKHGSVHGSFKQLQDVMGI